MAKPQAVQFPPGIAQALMNKVGERPYNEVWQLMDLAKAQARLVTPVEEDVPASTEGPKSGPSEGGEK